MCKQFLRVRNSGVCFKPVCGGASGYLQLATLESHQTNQLNLSVAASNFHSQDPTCL